ncbi:hypothetical protein [Citrobacter portucalensis]|uniref:hypothetical protein n=1 Tax=Citrobacter portucalensis TaxID=1639133 RepID=UPI0023AFCA36|nr:hypothetical protein [Citrobacter portucalensis]
MNHFKGLSINPYDALKNIANLIECGALLTVVDDGGEYSELGDVILGFAKDYAIAASNEFGEPTDA